MTSMSFELLRSEDEVTRNAGRRMIDRMATISSGLDEHWRLIGDLTGIHMAQEQVETVTEIQLQRKVVTPIGG
ncbi:Aconitase A [Pseudomonas syringae pv. actinidiae]|nr:Aconitase A [Pseudomonas syringae pv. actinidiae]GBH19534.1 Aconitase A [Pseudomonas syringae pv. actinidiae]